MRARNRKREAMMDRKQIHKTLTVTALIMLIIPSSNLITGVHAKFEAFTAAISPVEANVSQLATYTFNITNTGDGATLGSATIAIPEGFTILSPITILNLPSSWISSLSATEISLTAIGGNAILQQGESIMLTFEASAPNSPGIATWATQATSSIQGGGTIIPLQGELPKVTVVANPTLFAPELTATPNPVSQNQASTLASSPVTTGTPPYTYQWFQKTPGGEYTQVGTSSPSYTFPGSTTTGDWEFLIRVMDSTGASVNSTALILAVNAAPTFTIIVTQTIHGTITPGTLSVSQGNDQPFTISPDVGYQIADVFVDGSSIGVVTSYLFSGVTSDHTITATFTVAVGTCFINVASSRGSPSPSAQVNAGNSFNAWVTSPWGDTNHRWICTGYSIDGAQSVSGTNYTFVNIQANHTITFNWQEQYYLNVVSPTISTTGAGWYNAGTTATISVTGNTVVAGSGTRQIFIGWAGDAAGTGTTSNPITLDGPKTATTIWKTQYQVTYAASGNIMQISVPPEEWVDEGETAVGTFPTSITNSAGNTRKVFSGDDRPTVITEPTTITGTYQIQYLVTFSQNGIAPDTLRTIATIQDETKTLQQLPTGIWINAGESVTFTFATAFQTTEADKQYNLAKVNSTSPLTINEPTTIQASYELQTISSNFTLSAITIAAISLSIPAGLSIPAVVMRRKRKKKITPIATEGGTISPNTVQTIERGGDSTVFIITANPGYTIADVVIDKTKHIGPVRTYIFDNVTKNHTISANFKN